MVQAKGLTNRAVANIILNNDSEEDFGSDNNNEFSESESEYEVKVILMQRINFQWTVLMKQLRGKNKLQKWMLNPLCSSQDENPHRLHYFPL